MTRRLRRLRHLRWLWVVSGLAGAASAGRKELDRRGQNALIFDSPRDAVTVVIARGDRARQLREAWRRVFEESEMHVDVQDGSEL